MFTKKQFQQIAERTCVVETSESTSKIIVAFALTEGQLLALKYALENHNTPVGRDVHGALIRAIDAAGVA